MITVITVVYNGAEFIEETIQSVLGQSHPRVEYVVIDGGSTDGTQEIVRRYADRIDFWVSEPDEGIYDAMNKGLRHAHGDLVAFLNASDRYYDENVLAAVAALAVRKPAADVYFGALQYVDMACGVNRIVPAPATWSQERVEYLHPAAFVRSHVFCTLRFNTRYPVAADRDFFVRMQRSGMKMYADEAVYACFRSGGMSSGHKMLLDCLDIDIRCFGWPYAIRSVIRGSFSLLANNILPERLLCWMRANQDGTSKKSEMR